MKGITTVKWFNNNLIQFVFIFVSVLFAFSLSEWSNKREERITEVKILKEISNSLKRDLYDLDNNVFAYEMSERSIEIVKEWLDGNNTPNDSLNLYYQIMLRNYTPIINRSAYESLKSTNIKIISNDSLRLDIISMYDYYYRMVEKLEDEIFEMQDYRNHSEKVNKIISPYMIFDENIQLIGLADASEISEKDKNSILESFWKVTENRKFKVQLYNDIISQINLLEQKIDKELDKLN